MPRTCIHLELFTHCWSFINSGQDCKVPYCRCLCSSSWAKTTEVSNISSCIQLVPVSHHWSWAEIQLLTPCSSRFKQNMSYAVVHLLCVVFRRRRQVMGTNSQSCSYCWVALCYFSLVCLKESLFSATLPLDPGGNTSKAEQLKWILIPCRVT